MITYNYNDILGEKIKQAKVAINHERYNLSLLLKQKTKQRQGIEIWLDHSFTSSSQTTPEFLAFYADVKQFIINLLANDYKIKLSMGHFYFYGFLRNKNNNKWCYFSCSDVRFFKNGWYNNLLIRTANHDKDFTGGMNKFSALFDLKSGADKLTA